MDLQLGLSLGGVSSSLSSLLASILYQTSLGDFVYRTDESGNVILDNQGNEGSLYDGLIFSGRGIELGALNDVTVGDVSKWTTYFDFATATHVKAFGVQVLNTKTINSILVSVNEPSAETLSIFDANPNLVGKLAKSATGTIPEVDLTLVASDSYYMCSEKSGAYLVDSRVDYGTTIVTNGTFDTDTDWTKGAGWTISAGVASSDGTQVADSLLTTSTVPVTVASSTYLVSFQVTAYTSGNVALQFDGVEIIPDKAAVGTYYAIATASDTTGTIDIVADLNFIGSVDNVTAQLISSIPIANYASTVRTNADLQQKGIQTTAFVTDGAGVPTAYSSDLLQFNGDGRYLDTRWRPSASPFIVEVGFYTDNNTVGFPKIISAGTDLQIELRPTPGDIKVFIGQSAGVIHSLSINTFYFISLHSDGNYEINGISQTQQTISSYSGLRNLFLGNDNLFANPYSEQIDHFKVITNQSQVDNYDALQAYNDYIA